MMPTSPFGKRCMIFFTTVVFPEPVPPAIPMIIIDLEIKVCDTLEIVVQTYTKKITLHQ